MRQIRCCATGRSDVTLRLMPQTLSYARAETALPRANPAFVVPMLLLCVALGARFGWNIYFAATFDPTGRGPDTQYNGEAAEGEACLLFLPMLCIFALTMSSVVGRSYVATLMLAVGLALAFCAVAVTGISILLTTLLATQIDWLEAAKTVGVFGMLLSLIATALMGGSLYAEQLRKQRHDERVYG